MYTIPEIHVSMNKVYNMWYWCFKKELGSWFVDEIVSREHLVILGPMLHWALFDIKSHEKGLVVKDDFRTMVVQYGVNVRCCIR